MPALTLASLSPFVVVLIGSGDLASDFRPRIESVHPTTTACTSADNLATAVADGFQSFACHSLPPCRSEDDDRPCWWNAATRGNGIGRTFAHLGDDVVAYLD